MISPKSSHPIRTCPVFSLTNWLMLTILGTVTLLSGCENINSQMATAAAITGVQALTLSDKDVRSVSQQAASQMDQKNPVAPASSPYAQRLARLVAPHQIVNGVRMNYAVYASQDVNAFAMADGTVRVYAGLMDLLDDHELLFVIGHEAGHVVLEHSKRAMKLALSASAIRQGSAAVGGTIGAIAESQLTDLTQAVLQAQFSQSEEKAADDFGLEFMRRHGYPVSASVSALRKLGHEGGGLLSSHPNPQDRADRLEHH